MEELADSTNPFLEKNSTSRQNNDGYDKIFNPLKIDQTVMYPNDLGSMPPSSSDLKMIPLPDDILGLESAQPSNSFFQNVSFNIENYIKNEVIENDTIDNDFLDANFNSNLLNLQPNNPEYGAYNYDTKEDLESVLLDLGISEAIASQDDPLFQQEQQPHQPAFKQHQKKISGSGIFGFVGVGNDSQLAIPGIPPVNFVDKKPVYKEVLHYDDLTFEDPTPIITESNSMLGSIKQQQSKIHATPPKPKERKLRKNDYFVSSGSQSSYKFPPSPPRGSFDNMVPASINPFCTQQPGHFQGNTPRVQLQSQQKPLQRSPLPTPMPTSPLHSVAMSSPIKEPNSFQTPRFGSPSKMIQSKFTAKLNQVRKEEMNGNETSVTDDDKDRTISQFATPLKIKSVNINNFQTPSPSKAIPNISWNPANVTKHNRVTEEILKAQQPTPVRKKPTITSTLATGTLDKYFIGPTTNGKFICKFFDKEIGTTCEREFTRISNIRAHIQTHLCDRPFACDKCDKRFVRNHDLTRHQKGHVEFSNVCPCGKKFPRADALRRHRARNICCGGLSPNPSSVTKPSSSNNNSKRIKDNNTQVDVKNSKISHIIVEDLMMNPANNAPRSTVRRDIHSNSNFGNNERNLVASNVNNISKDVDIFDFNRITENADDFSFSINEDLNIQV